MTAGKQLKAEIEVIWVCSGCDMEHESEEEALGCCPYYQAWRCVNCGLNFDHVPEGPCEDCEDMKND